MYSKPVHLGDDRKGEEGKQKRWGGKEKRKKKKGKKSMAARVEHLWRTAHLMCTPQPGS